MLQQRIGANPLPGGREGRAGAPHRPARGRQARLLRRARLDAEEEAGAKGGSLMLPLEVSGAHRTDAAVKLVKRGTFLCTPKAVMAVVIDGRSETLTPGVSRLDPSHELVKRNPEKVKPADAADTQTRDRLRSMVGVRTTTRTARVRPSGKSRCTGQAPCRPSPSLGGCQHASQPRASCRERRRPDVGGAARKARAAIRAKAEAATCLLHPPR